MITRIFIALGILILGIPIAKIIEGIALSIYRRRNGVSLEKPIIGSIAFNATMTFVLAVVLGYIKIDADFSSIIENVNVLSEILTILLILFITIVFTRLVTLIITQVVKTSGLKSLVETYALDSIYSIAHWILAFFIFSSFGSSLLHIVGFDVIPFFNFLRLLGVPFLVVVLLGIFVATKDIIKEFGVGIYVKNSKLVRLGNYVILKDKTEMKVREIKLCGIIVSDKEKNTFIPHSEIMSGLSLKKTKTVIERLEDIKQQYVAQDPSYCGPASLSMVLKMFGYNHTQHEIGEKAKTKVSQQGEPAGTTPQSLIDVAKLLTDNKVIGAWIDSDHITDLRSELLSWLNDEALIIIDYKKSYLFSKAKKAHYSICLGVNGQELLLLDPSSKAGGVYYADCNRVAAGMDTFSPLFNGKRGYIVFAIDGTPAYRRIKNGLIYLDENLYTTINKTISKALVELQEKTHKVRAILPSKLNKLLGKEEKIARIWKPTIEKEDNE